MVQANVAVCIMLTVAIVWIMRLGMEGKMKTVVKTIMLTVGHAILGRPGLAVCFQHQRREGRMASRGTDRNMGES